MPPSSLNINHHRWGHHHLLTSLHDLLWHSSTIIRIILIFKVVNPATSQIVNSLFNDETSKDSQPVPVWSKLSNNKLVTSGDLHPNKARPGACAHNRWVYWKKKREKNVHTIGEKKRIFWSVIQRRGCLCQRHGSHLELWHWRDIVNHQVWLGRSGICRTSVRKYENVLNQMMTMMMIKVRMRDQGQVLMNMIRDQGEVLALSFNPHIQILATGGYY